MTVKLLTEQHLEFLSLKGGCTGSFESTLVKMPHCWKSHVTAQIIFAGHLPRRISEIVVNFSCILACWVIFHNPLSSEN